MNIYVGNISWDSTEEELKNAFAAHGAVSSVKIITDKFTGRSRGFGFVEMPEKTEAESAITSLNGKDLKGRKIVVNEARPKREGGRGNRSSRGYQSQW
jgi:RNA recognition motif-containing protein